MNQFKSMFQLSGVHYTLVLARILLCADGALDRLWCCYERPDLNCIRGARRPYGPKALRLFKCFYSMFLGFRLFSYGFISESTDLTIKAVSEYCRDHEKNTK